MGKQTVAEDEEQKNCVIKLEEKLMITEYLFCEWTIPSSIGSQNVLRFVQMK